MKANNPLYKDIIINFDLIHIREDKFLPIGMAGNVLQYKPDFSKREYYAVNLESNNFDNRLHQAVDATGHNYLGCISNWLYTDTDNIWKHPTTKLVSILINYKNLGTSINTISKVSIFIYQTKSYITVKIDQLINY